MSAFFWFVMGFLVGFIIGLFTIAMLIHYDNEDWDDD